MKTKYIIKIAQKYKAQLITYTGKKNQMIVLPSLVIFFFTTMKAINNNTAIEIDEITVNVIFDILIFSSFQKGVPFWNVKYCQIIIHNVIIKVEKRDKIESL